MSKKNNFPCQKCLFANQCTDYQIGRNYLLDCVRWKSDQRILTAITLIARSLKPTSRQFRETISKIIDSLCNVMGAVSDSDWETACLFAEKLPRCLAIRGGSTEKAQRALLLALRNGPKPQKDIMAALQSQGFSEKTIRRAKQALGVVSRKQSFAGGWEWCFPEQARNEGDNSWRE